MKRENYDWGTHSDQINTDINEKSDTDNPPERHNQTNNSVEFSMSQIFGTKDPGNTDMNQQFQDVFCESLNIMTFPEPILMQFKKAKWITPSIIINTFGGSLTALAQQLCFHNSSIFIDDFPDVTKSLIRFSRHELGTSFQTASYKTRT